MRIYDHDVGKGGVKKVGIFLTGNGLMEKINKQKSKKGHNVGIPGKIRIFYDYRRNGVKKGGDKTSIFIKPLLTNKIEEDDGGHG